MKQYKIEIKWAVIFTIMTLLWMACEKLIGLHDQYIDRHLLYTNLIAIPAIAIYFFAIREKKINFYHGQMDFREGLRCGFVMTLIIAVLAPLNQYLISTFISPDYFKNAIAYAVEQKMFTQDQAEDYFSLKSYLKQSVFGALVMGILTSAIISLILKNKATAPQGK